MGFETLSHAEKSILIGLIHKGGSTSETLAYGFVSGDLSALDGYTFVTAWQRLDAGQQDAVITVREIANLGRHCYEIGSVIVPDRATFVSEFMRWKRESMLNQKYHDWMEANNWRGVGENKEDLPEDVYLQHLDSVESEFMKYVKQF